MRPPQFSEPATDPNLVLRLVPTVVSTVMRTTAIRAAISSLGTDLARELGPHGIGVSVVTTGAGGSRDFALAQVADVVEALLSTPVLSGVSSRIG